MEMLGLFGICIVGTLLPLVSPEASAVLYGKELGWPPLAVGVVGAAGQCVVYLVLYVAGERLLAKWKKLGAMVERTRLRYHTHLRRRFGLVSLLAATIGLPPAVSVAALAPGLGISLHLVLSILFAGRVFRLGVLAAGGEWLNRWWGPLL